MNARTFVIQLECRLEENSGTASTASAAYANAYVKAHEEGEAVRLAECELEAAGWKATADCTCKEVSEESFEPGSKGLEYFEQCQIDGVVLVLHTWRDEH